MVDQQIKKEQTIREKAVKAFVKNWQGRSDYLKNPKVLKQALDEYEELMAEYGFWGKTGYYYWLQTTQNEQDPKVKAAYTQAMDFGNRLKNEASFFELNISKIPSNIQNKLLKSPLLRDYKHFLNKSFTQSRHILSIEEEKILTLKSQTSYENWVKMTSSFLSREEREIEVVKDGPKGTKGPKGSKEKKSFMQILELAISKVKKIGVDMTDKIFRETGLKELELLLKNAEKLARKLGKI